MAVARQPLRRPFNPPPAINEFGIGAQTAKIPVSLSLQRKQVITAMIVLLRQSTNAKIRALHHYQVIDVFVDLSGLILTMVVLSGDQV